jgi:hypothetical protein
MSQTLILGQDSDDKFWIVSTEDIFVDELSNFKRKLEKWRLQLF